VLSSAAAVVDSKLVDVNSTVLVEVADATVVISVLVVETSDDVVATSPRVVVTSMLAVIDPDVVN